MSSSIASGDDLSHRRIRRKPPPTLDRYPSPDPLDPFAPLWVLRNRTNSGLSSQDIVSRNQQTSYLYSTTTAQLSLDTSISPIHIPSPKDKIGHYRPYSRTFFDSPQGFPLVSSPLASQPDLLYPHQPFPDQHSNVRSPRQTFDTNDGSSGTESDTPPRQKSFSQHRHTASAGYRFPKLLHKKPSFLGSGKIRSPMVDLNQMQKSSISPPVLSTVTWVPHSVSSHSKNSQSTSLSADTLDCGSLALTSDEDVFHQYHPHHNGRHVSADARKDLKQELTKPRKLPCISICPKMLRKKASSTRPFSSIVAPRTRSLSCSSYVHISMPRPVPSFSQPTSEDAYTSPRKAPAPPPEAPKECPDQTCRYKCIHSISSEWGLPSLLQLNYAASLPIVGDDGKHITFGSLFESQRTVVIFIRHFWCPLCQDYMSSVKSFVHPDMVCNTCDDRRNQSQGFNHDAGSRVRFVVISNGAHSMIAKYRQIFGLPFKMYTDPSLALYQALGLGKDSNIKHHNCQPPRHSASTGGKDVDVKHRRSGSSEAISEKNSRISKRGGYVKHSLMGGIAMVVVRALKVCMPVWEKGGDIDQLGGEFVFGPGLTCTYAHRMQTTKGHAAIEDVLQAAGISLATNRTATLSSAEDSRAQPEPTVTVLPTPSTSENVPRRRRESINTLGDKEINQPKTARQASRRYSIGVMSLEDEDQWMEYRQNDIERIRERKDLRRGINHAVSVQAQWSRRPLEMVGDVNKRQSPIAEDSDDESFSPVPVRVSRRYSMNY